VAVLERETVDTTPRPSADAIPASLWRGGVSSGRVVAIILVGSLVLALFASRDLSSWAERLGAGPLAEQTQTGAARWDQTMEALGFARPHDTLRSAVDSLLECQWNSGPDQTGLSK
jgi:hypothetical protein